MLSRKILSYFLVFLLIFLTSVSVPVFFWISNAFPTNDSLRNKVMQEIGIEELHAWGNEVLEGKIAGFLSYSEIPENVARIGSSVVVTKNEVNVEDHILIIVRGGHYHCGIMIGRPGFVPYPDSQYEFYKWAEGVWAKFEK